MEDSHGMQNAPNPLDEMSTRNLVGSDELQLSRLRSIIDLDEIDVFETITI